MKNNISKQISFFLPSSAGLWVKHLLSETNTLWLVYTDEKELHEAKLSIRAFNPQLQVQIFPQWDTLPYAAASPAVAIQMQRQVVLKEINATTSPLIILSTVAAVTQKISPQDQTAAHVQIKVDTSLDIDTLVRTLISLGFARVETVYQPGEFSIRGGVIDVFAPDQTHPHRIDLFGDTVESIHPFDPATQRREKDKNLQHIVISSHQEILLTSDNIETFKKKYVTQYGVENRGDYFRSVTDNAPINGWEQLYPLFFETTEPLFQYLKNVTFILPQKSVFETYIKELDESYIYRKQLWDNAPVKERQLPPILPSALYCTSFEQDILRQSNTHIYAPYKQPEGLDIGIRPLSPLTSESVSEKLNDAIKNAEKAKLKLICVADEAQDIRYLKSAYENNTQKTLPQFSSWDEINKTSEKIVLWNEKLLRCIVTPSCCIVTPSELFGERQKNFKKRTAVAKPEDIISQATSLNIGDLVVHRKHGIGRYLGLKTIEVFNVTHDCLAIEYAAQDKLFLPVENIELLSRYGSDQGSVALDKIGGTSWQSRQLKVKKQLRTIAKYLMDIAAKRMLKTAPMINANEGVFQEFCRRFTFVETEDQEKAILDVVTDLAKGTPMDRLICGDVGFGKTEVALRAAFLAASKGYQVGIVAPTTILARQHYHSFNKRFEGLGYKIEQISRLVKPSEVTRIKKATADGDVAILIGTHALLHNTVKFKNLGLLIVDEEQMFGVKQKEKIKELCNNIHVLTLTATPIPRTLQMSLLGIKEMSLIATPPVDRRAIQTSLSEEDPIVIHQAIQHEIDRGGQVFYVCPRISDLEMLKTSLVSSFPQLKIVVAHGQLKPAEIEERLIEFIEKKAHILLSTQIIESGIDIPNANTMIIHNAHMFGLSQLYQLRGRIGRSTRQAYAYLIIPQGRMLNPTAIKRLQVMSTLDALGAGFTLASHDLDIRGAGNLLGEEQSGHIKDVGVELYQDMLKQAVNTLKKSGSLEAEEELWSPVLSLGLSVGLPETYIQDIETRMDLYRRLGTLETNEQVNDLRAELLDRFGRLPIEAENLIQTIKIKITCRYANIQKVETGPNGVLFTFRNNQCPYVIKLLTLIQTNMNYKMRPDSKLFYQWAIDDIHERVNNVKKICKQLRSFNLADAHN
ncbi:MAG: transcription-repair coupling factor [Candidatus Paracaedibacteraceae bacterium]|nr:transcription-repair coupling factor [Candidatus Paracaedibacteraceae bacterium]